MKIVQLITGIATHALVDVLKRRLPSANFGYFFNGMKNRLALLLDEREYQLLYPDNSKYNGDLSDLDISLLYIILRNLNTITPHENFWGNRPNDDDRCLSANIERIRIFKNNFVSHCSKYSLNEENFLKTWKEISQCIIELGGEEYNQEVDVLFTSAINPLMELEFVCNAREKFEESKRDERKVIILKGIFLSRVCCNFPKLSVITFQMINIHSFIKHQLCVHMVYLVFVFTKIV